MGFTALFSPTLARITLTKGRTLYTIRRPKQKGVLDFVRAQKTNRKYQQIKEQRYYDSHKLA
jgi:hypothetical protein